MFAAKKGKTARLGALGVVLVLLVAGTLGVPSTADAGPDDSVESCSNAEDDCPAPGDTGTGLAPAPPAALPVAVNVFAILATLLAILGIVVGLRTRYRL
ncbi:MAG: hypothetical protein OXI51_00135 [Chloroflexota bacterium]|nr:hypothetical protein [Chloroflexota bacterium]